MKAMTLQELIAWEPSVADLGESIQWLNERIQKVKQDSGTPLIHKTESIKRYEKDLAEEKLALKLKLEQEARGGKGR